METQGPTKPPQFDLQELPDSLMVALRNPNTNKFHTLNGRVSDPAQFEPSEPGGLDSDLWYQA